MVITARPDFFDEFQGAIWYDEVEVQAANGCYTVTHRSDA